MEFDSPVEVGKLIFSTGYHFDREPQKARALFFVAIFEAKKKAGEVLLRLWGFPPEVELRQRKFLGTGRVEGSPRSLDREKRPTQWAGRFVRSLLAVC